MLFLSTHFQNQTLEKRLHEANVRIGSLEVTVKKSKLLGKELARKDKVVSEPLLSIYFRFRNGINFIFHRYGRLKGA